MSIVKEKCSRNWDLGCHFGCDAAIKNQIAWMLVKNSFCNIFGSWALMSARTVRRMKIEKKTLYFIGHDGLMQALSFSHADTMYIPDANLVLSLIQSHTNRKLPTSRHKHFLAVSKQAIMRSWHQQKNWIPVNPVLALMELTKQNETANYESYLKLYRAFFEEVYSVQDVAPQWVASTYLAALKAHINTHPSICKTIEQIYLLCPNDEKPTDLAVIESCEKFFGWVWEEGVNLFMIGGPLIYLAVYAFSGSPQARAFIKYSKRSKESASNVAWDLLYWVILEMDYHQTRYENTVVCTSDRALTELLLSRINRGPRGQVDRNGDAYYVESYGDFDPVRLKRLENTKLEAEIAKRMVELLSALEVVDQESIRFGFNELNFAK